MEVTRNDVIDARDRALRAVALAQTVDDAQDSWRLAKAYNLYARELGGAGTALGNAGQPLAHGPEGSFSARETGR